MWLGVVAADLQLYSTEPDPPLLLLKLVWTVACVTKNLKWQFSWSADPICCNYLTLPIKCELSEGRDYVWNISVSLVLSTQPKTEKARRKNVLTAKWNVSHYIINPVWVTASSAEPRAGLQLLRNISVVIMLLHSTEENRLLSKIMFAWQTVKPPIRGNHVHGGIMLAWPMLNII